MNQANPSYQQEKTNQQIHSLLDFSRDVLPLGIKHEEKKHIET